MKGWVGVAGPKMSPGRIAPLSNSRNLTKEPFTQPLMPHALTPNPRTHKHTHTHTHTHTHSLTYLHNLHPALSSQPGLFRASYRGHRIGEFPLQV